MQGMSEFKYVCMVESMIFTCVLTLLITFRFDVLNWNSDESWPVFSTVSLIILLYTYIFLLPCVVLFSNQMSAEVKEFVSTAISIVLKLLFILFSLVIHVALHAIFIESKQRQLFLCQLLATECNVQSEQVWSGTHTFVYGFFITPLTVFTIGLLTHVAFSFQLPAKYSPWTLCMNLVYLMLAHVFLTLENNYAKACADDCRIPKTFATNVTVFDLKPQVEIITFFSVTVAGLVLFATDIMYSLYINTHIDTKTNTQTACLLTAAVRILQLGSQIVYTLLQPIPIPHVNLYTHIGLYVCCIISDLLKIFFFEQAKQQNTTDIQFQKVSIEPIEPFAFDNTKKIRLNVHSRALWSGAESVLQTSRHQLHSKKTK